MDTVIWTNSVTAHAFIKGTWNSRYKKTNGKAASALHRCYLFHSETHVSPVGYSNTACIDSN